MEPLVLFENEPLTNSIQSRDSTIVPIQHYEKIPNNKEESNTIIEADKLIHDATILLEESQSPQLKPKSSTSQPLQKLKSQTNIQAEPFSSQFWRKTTSWKKRKKIALKTIKNFNTSIHHLAYEGKLEKIKSIDEEEKLKLFEIETKEPGKGQVKPKKKKLLAQDKLGLTPLIYAIWGEEDRGDESKLTSKWLFEWSLEKYKQKIGDDYGKMESAGQFFDPALKNELGHAKVHNIITQVKLQMYHLIVEDYHESLAYLIEKKGFKLKDKSFSHSVCDKDRKISIAALGC